MLGNSVKISAQNDLADEGKYNMVEGICLGLNGEYPDWKSPIQTYMVPDTFPSRQGDKGSSAEYIIYSRLQECGAQLEEPMFVVHSCPFSEHIPESERKRSWVMGETDFVIIHKNHGPIYIEVKATDTGKSFKEAEDQLQKGKLALKKRFENAVKGEIPAKQVTDIFKNFPAFVAMPNCPRPDPRCARANVLYQEDCSSLVNFVEWWKKNVDNASPPPVTPKMYECLVIWFVGVLYLNHVHDRINYDDKTLNFLTKLQMKILEGFCPPEQWIRGPAGSGKTYLLIGKAVTLAKGILSDSAKANEKILVLCFNSVLCKAISKAISKSIKRIFPEGKNVDPFLHCVTFARLIESLAHLPKAPSSYQDKEDSVNLALENLEKRASTGGAIIYDHILVDEGQDLYGKMWPELLRLMHKNRSLSEKDFLAKARTFWVMFDMNQYLYFAKEQACSHFQYLRGSLLLDKVFRNTRNVFEQSKKYFSDDSPITLGHAVCGLPIKWDASLVSRSVDDQSGAYFIVRWMEKLQNQKVNPKDICILVETQEKQRTLSRVMKSIDVKSQTGDELVEESFNYVVLESIPRFKGMGSKVVILYDPPYKADHYQFSNCTKELLYTAVSRCTCLLVVITTEEGCQTLQSNVGMN